MNTETIEADIKSWLPTPKKERFVASGFLTAKYLTEALGVSNRKLQWWHESKVVVPRVESHVRLYDHDSALVVAAIAHLHTRSVSLKATRRFLRPLRRVLAQRPLPEYLIVSSKDVAACTAEQVASVASALGRVTVVSVGSLLKKLKIKDG
jgi:DNA-binding transcriptional MerR regulator